MHHFGNWVKERREKLSYTQATLAQQVGVSVATIRNWEHAEHFPRLSVPVKAALADALRMTLMQLEAVGSGDDGDVPIGPVPEDRPEIRPKIHIENWDRARVLLKGVATNNATIRPEGYLPHKFTSPDVHEFAWIMEDDSMEGIGGYLKGDVIAFAASTGIPAGSDVMVQVAGKCLGVVRRLFYSEDKAVLFALNTHDGKYPPQFVSLKDVSMMAMAVAVFRAK